MAFNLKMRLFYNAAKKQKQKKKRLIVDVHD